MEFETMGFDEDHVHFMLKSLPKYSPWGRLKSISKFNL